MNSNERSLESDCSSEASGEVDGNRDIESFVDDRGNDGLDQLDCDVDFWNGLDQID